MVDTQTVDEPVGHPPHDLVMRLLEDPWHLDAHRRQRVHGEEPAKVQVGIGTSPVDELVVLTTMDLLGARSVVGGPRRERETVIVVAQLALLDAQIPLVLVAEHRDAHLAVAEIPVDVECFGVRATIAHG